MRLTIYSARHVRTAPSLGRGPHQEAERPSSTSAAARLVLGAGLTSPSPPWHRTSRPPARSRDLAAAKIVPMPSTLADLEARIAALEAERADYRAVLAAINVLGENQRAHSERTEAVETRLGSVENRLGSVESKLDDTGTRVRTIEDNLAEVKDLLIRALDN